MIRLTIILLSTLAILTLGACGWVRGSKDVETDVGGADGLSNGPGIVTGKRGGIIIYQK